MKVSEPSHYPPNYMGIFGLLSDNPIPHELFNNELIHPAGHDDIYIGTNSRIRPYKGAWKVEEYHHSYYGGCIGVFDTYQNALIKWHQVACYKYNKGQMYRLSSTHNLFPREPGESYEQWEARFWRDCDSGESMKQECEKYSPGRLAKTTYEYDKLLKEYERQYEECKKAAFNSIHEELIAAAMHPRRMAQFVEDWDETEDEFYPI